MCRFKLVPKRFTSNSTSVVLQAGFKTFLSKVSQFTKGGFEAWLRMQNATIVCVQEVKISKKDVADEPRRWAASLSEYESFWAFNDGTGGQRLGLNGVTTFVRKGLTLAADSAPLGNKELDGEGRCIMTDHGEFVVFNVYVPNSSGGARVPYKQRWLRALRAAMQRQRERGKAVLLVGDLNMKHRSMDQHWESYTVAPPTFLGAVERLRSTQQVSLLQPFLN